MEIVRTIESEILNPIIALLFALAVVYFLFGLMEFIKNPNNEEEQTKGKSHMVWGVVGIFLMIAVYGILDFIATSLGVPKVPR